MKMMIRLAGVCACSLLVLQRAPSVSSSTSAKEAMATQQLVPVQQAVQTAMETLQKRKLFYGDEFKLTVKKLPDKWVLWFVFLPETPGKDVTVFVDSAGNAEVSVGF